MVTASPQPAPAPTRGGEAYTVRQGETLYRIANNTQHAGVSLDQMLVALYRSNPQAFMDGNMNRLRAGAVLNVPSADEVRQINGGEARQVIQAQSADFGAYRQRLAGVVPTVRPDEPARQARGQVQAQVDDRKQAAAAAPDRLKLSQGSVQASAPDARASGDTQRRDDAAQFHARQRSQLARLVDASGNQYRIMFLLKIGKRLCINICIQMENDAACFILLDSPRHDFFIQLEIRNAIDQKATCTVCPLIDMHLVAIAAEYFGGGKSRRTGANDANAFRAFTY
mgnify:CR=1 FL=1